jgi:hypothetical protein
MSLTALSQILRFEDLMACPGSTNDPNGSALVAFNAHWSYDSNGYPNVSVYLIFQFLFALEFPFSRFWRVFYGKQTYKIAPKSQFLSPSAPGGVISTIWSLWFLWYMPICVLWCPSNFHRPKSHFDPAGLFAFLCHISPVPMCVSLCSIVSIFALALP